MDNHWLTPYRRKLLICAFTGFTSGLPLFFILNLVPVWLRGAGVSLRDLGYMALIQLPFTVKFLWSPLLDRYTLPFLGRRRGWLLVAQLVITAAMAAYAWLNPQRDMFWIVATSCLLTFFSATQDIVIDAFRREILSDDELGAGNAMHVNVYRIAALVPGSFSLIMADYFAWSTVFYLTAMFMLPGIVMTLSVKEPVLAENPYRSWKDTVVLPFRDFFRRRGVRHALWIFAFIVLYKLGDSMATALISPFYVDMGYSKSDIGIIAKNAGLWPAVIFGFLGVIWLRKWGINRCLWLFGVVQMVTILGFAWLAAQGPFAQIGVYEKAALAGVVAAEYIGVGLGTAAFVAFIARETNPLFAATQFALLSALSAVPRTFINAASGVLIDRLGYTDYFWLCFVLALPGMLVLLKVAPWNGNKKVQAA